MDVFKLHGSLVGDYSDFVTSFHTIQDERVRQFVDEQLKEGLLWPEPLLQLNPNFKKGASIDELCQEGVLHEQCKEIFRLRSEGNPIGDALRLHLHQEQAIRISQKKEPYVLTTGTGSGKSMTYIIPVVDHVLKNGSGNGIQAILVYPMNALANSQMEELEKFIPSNGSGGSSPVTFARYTGQESDGDRQKILQDPPDILITNYMMLELILTRPDERKLVDRCKDLNFLVLDELHTYRGRQGADISMLVRRCREFFNRDKMLCIGTSATMASEKDATAKVSIVASKIFGREVLEENVVEETLERMTPEMDESDSSILDQLRKEVSGYSAMPTDFEELKNTILASWVETNFGLEREGENWVRKKPAPLDGEGGGAQKLATLLGINPQETKTAIQQLLESGVAARNPADPTGRSRLFAFRLHQFISRGDTVWSTLENKDQRSFMARGQVFLPGSDTEKRVYPLVFCKDCGQEYYRVDRPGPQNPQQECRARISFDSNGEADWESGYLYISEQYPWPTDPESVRQRVPDSWREVTNAGTERIKRSRRDHVPEVLSAKPSGEVADTGDVAVAWIPGGFRFCLNPSCGVVYSGQQRSDAVKLRTLGVDGRSTATTLFAISVLKSLQGSEDLAAEAKKLLSFTDNRQDASLQAGHFNDFVLVASVRSGLLAALVAAGDTGIRATNLAQALLDGIDLPLAEYADNPDARGLAREDSESALRSVLSYHTYRDLERGWRINTPNLEQCGLLHFDYRGLKDCVSDEEIWGDATTPQSLRDATVDQRERICRVLLNHLRKNLCIATDVLRPVEQEKIAQKSRARLAGAWEIKTEEQDAMLRGRLARACSKRDLRGSRFQTDIFLSGRSSYAQHLKSSGGISDEVLDLSANDCQLAIASILQHLTQHGLLIVGEKNNDPTTYQINDDAILWELGDGTPVSDPLREVVASEVGQASDTGNTFFRTFYKSYTELRLQLEGREHTAQVPAGTREEREDDFRSAKLPLLFCSPTMELGVDISRLNVVNLRNVPPTPSNYAQRSGRAGRNGDPALVYTYCSGFSPHDQYYFRRPEQMVAGKVLAPNIDLCNEDLIRSHIQAVWLHEARLSLGKTLGDVLQVSERDLACPLKEDFANRLDDGGAKASAHSRIANILQDLVPELESTDWYDSDWAKTELDKITDRFEEACRRWRNLYRAAVQQRNQQHAVVGDHSRPKHERDQAKRLRAHAESQISLLTEARGVYEGDFYSYRYFASEGFLPGYNFPRLPVTAFIPGRRGARGRDNFLSRPRFLAINEFGPQAILYHEGQQYRISEVNLGVAEDAQDLPKATLKLCTECGCMHEISAESNPDTCHHCSGELTLTIDNAVRIEGVRARPTRRISSEQEERTRVGYEIASGFHFDRADGSTTERISTAKENTESLAVLRFGENTKIWRVNKGWRLRSNQDELGFNLDVERGKWSQNRSDETQNGASDADDPQGARIERVVPYVDDHRNALTFQLVSNRDAQMYTSLLSALKNSIQQQYQIEPRELSGEILPERDKPRDLLFVEQSEGGAGILRQVWSDKNAVPRLARRALEICHFDPDTGEDLAESQQVECEAACYDCLLSYENQRDHELIDRHKIKDLLLRLSNATMESSSSGKSRAQHLEDLKAVCESQLEKKFLDLLEQENLTLPTHGQKPLVALKTRPDFTYNDKGVHIYVDGPHHDASDQQSEDAAIDDRMADAGKLVIRFHHAADWLSVIDEHPSVFGRRN